MSGPVTSLVVTSSSASAPAAGQAPTSNTAAVLTLTGSPGQSWYVQQINWSYSGTPVNGQFTIAWTDTNAGAVQEVYYVTNAGPGIFSLPPRQFPAGSSVTITLAAGGSGISGSIYADAWQA